MRTTKIAPKTAGINAKPPTAGPQLPKRKPPNEEPIKPTMMFPITPPGMFLLIII